jgi:S-adenosylmethionine-diacylglycerol 3-amino-3-carboxypropyl transferase
MADTGRSKNIKERALFKFLRYANCWEDADILLKALEIKIGGIYLSVCSAGDNTLSIVSSNPALVIAADISSAQLACLDLKKAAFLNLDYEGMLQFLGVRESEDRIPVYRSLSRSLSASAKAFWDNHPEFIKQGIIHGGKFESYFRIFRIWVLPLIHSTRDRVELRSPKDAKERIAFYRRRWDTAIWRLIFRIFFSKTVMGRLGRDPEFFRYVEGDVASRLLKRAEYALTALPTHDNPYLEYILTGSFDTALPHYLRPEHFDAIRNGLDRLVLFKGDVVEALEANRGLKFDGFNLSDIFEYMSNGEYLCALDRLIQAARRGGRLVYWNLLSDRVPPADHLDRLEPLEKRARELFMQDKAFFYKTLRLEVIT